MLRSERRFVATVGIVGVLALFTLSLFPRGKPVVPELEPAVTDAALWPPAGPLSGLTVYLSPGHGRYLQHSRVRDELLTWDFQREPAHGLTEDLWTVELAREVRQELVGRGATVVSLRELDDAPGTLIDDEDPRAHLSGIGRRVEGPNLAGGSGTWLERGTARFDVEAAPMVRSLYARWCAHRGAERATVEVRAGEVHRRIAIDQRGHAGSWWYLGEVPADVPVQVGFVGPGLCVDAVRAGGGRFDPEIPRSEPEALWRVAASHYLPALPAELAVDDRGRPVSDARYRPLWVGTVATDEEPAVYLSLHSDAGQGRGTSTFVGRELNPTVPPLAESEVLAAAVHPRVVAAARRLDPSWKDRGAGRLDLSEVSPLLNPLPSVLIEVGYHDHRKDAAMLVQPAFQRAIAAGIADGMVAYVSGERPSEDGVDGP